MSDGNAHNLNNLPIAHVGSMGGYFKMGQSVNVEDGSVSLARDNSEGQCDQVLLPRGAPIFVHVHGRTLT
jgi:hypothetical protein